MANFTHFNQDGEAIMVDVSQKDITMRIAIAEGSIKVNQEVFRSIKKTTKKNTRPDRLATMTRKFSYSSSPRRATFSRIVAQLVTKRTTLRPSPSLSQREKDTDLRKESTLLSSMITNNWLVTG